MDHRIAGQNDLLLRIGQTGFYVHADVERGNIANSRTDVIVSSEGTDGAMMGGVSHSILVKGGEEIRESLQAHMPLIPGEVVITSAGDLSPKVKTIYHAIVVGWKDERKVLQATIWRVVTRCMELSQLTGMTSIAFPSLGTGFGEAEVFESCNTMAAACMEGIRPNSTLRAIHFCFINREMGEIFARALLQQRLIRQTRGINTTSPSEKESLSVSLTQIWPDLLDMKTNLGKLSQLVRLLEENPTPHTINYYIETGGGTYIEGDVYTDGGDFTGHDQGK